MIEAAFTPRTRAIVPVQYARLRARWMPLLRSPGSRPWIVEGRGAGNHGGGGGVLGNARERGLGVMGGEWEGGRVRDVKGLG